MRSIVGLALLLTGLGLGAYAYYPETVQQHVHLANVTRVIAPIASAKRPGVITKFNIDQAAIWANNSPKTKPAPSPLVRNFSPGASLLAALTSFTETTDLETGSINKSNAEPRNAKAPNRVAAIPRTPVGGWHTVVKPAIANKHGARGMKSSQPADGSARYALIRDIQRELKRVGCYWGKVDGSWGNGSKWAMSEFVKQVNATLPTSDPDYILLSLARAQPEQVCGVEKDDTIIAAVAPAPTRALIPAKVHRAAVTLRRKSAHPTRTASLTQEKLTPPEPRRARPNIRTTKSPARRNLPGRMAIGGPIPNNIEATVDAPEGRNHPITTTTQKKARTDPPSNATVIQPPQRARIKVNTPSAYKIKRAKRQARLAKKAKQRANRRQYSQRRTKNPLSNLLKQGVY